MQRQRALAGGERARHTYLAALDRIVLPALTRFAPELVIVASGLDACALDPLGRMMLHSETYRAMPARINAHADLQCDGRLVVIYETGYSEAYAPFCGHAILEELAGVRTAVIDPTLEVLQAQQPKERVLRFHRALIDEMAAFVATDATA